MELWYVYRGISGVESKTEESGMENNQQDFRSLRTLKSEKVTFDLCGK